ncbi:MAG TPA: LysM peptidoglycan-binding domain-containing protein [Kofleriaceae bacterium]|nr:LysM peptidoglycan-binding domain-containing protein [Kofleriaceae bacterium]
MRAALVGAAAAALLAAAGGARAQQAEPDAAQEAPVDEGEAPSAAIHRVKRGDTLELLAAEYYGDRRHKIYIMIENGLDHARELRPGERLRIPVSNDITVGRTDTLASLAARYLGDERRARFLAEFNSLDPNGTVAAGMSITVPLRVTYRAARHEALADIARSLFADGRRAQTLRDYNFLKRDALEKGEQIIVPIFLRVHPSKRRPPDAESIALMNRRNEALETAERQLPVARRAWDSGDYARVKSTLSELVVNDSYPYLDTQLVVEIGVLLGAAHIAFDETDIALTHFRAVLKRAPAYALSAFEYSPKVCDVWRKAGGRVDDSPPP